VVTGQVSGLNSLLSFKKASLFTREQVPQPHTGNNNVEHTQKCKSLTRVGEMYTHTEVYYMYDSSTSE